MLVWISLGIASVCVVVIALDEAASAGHGRDECCVANHGAVSERDRAEGKDGMKALKPNSTHLLLAVDFAGTLVFAVEGAMAAAKGHLDLLGAMVLAFATALGGGIIRDVLIGAVPPNSIRDWRYAAIAFAGAGAVFFFYTLVQEIPQSLMLVLDAAGLSLFAVAGVEKALEFEIHPFIAILMGGITGVGGGTVRDVMLAEVPTVLRADVYATAALAGAAVVVIGRSLKLPKTAVAVTGIAVCFLLRMVSVWRHWNLPVLGMH